MPPRKGNGCSPQFPRDSVAAALAPPPLLKLTPHPLQGGHTLLPFHSIHRLPSKLLAQTMLSQGSSSFHACLPERHAQSAEESGSDLNRLESYKPIYFLMGSPNTKIEVSLKTKVIEGFNLYVGYSQLMMWELFRKSPYFSDLNYNPEIFYRMVLKADSKMIPTRWLDFGGFEHESNGKGGVNERSWNRSYLRYHDEVDSTMGSRVYWSIKAWGPYSEVPSVFRLPRQAVHATRFSPFCPRIQCSMNWIG